MIEAIAIAGAIWFIVLSMNDEDNNDGANANHNKNTVFTGLTPSEKAKMPSAPSKLDLFKAKRRMEAM